MPIGKQYRRCRQGAGDARPRNALDPHRPLLQGSIQDERSLQLQRISRQSGDILSARSVSAVRERALRAGLPGGRHGAQRRRLERYGLQPLHRGALLLEQLPLQSAPLQLPALPGLGDAATQASAQSGSHRAQPRGHGKVHLLRAAHQYRTHRSGKTEPPDPRRRDRHGVRTGLSHPSHHFRQRQRSGKPRSQIESTAAQLLDSCGTEYAPAYHISRGGAQSEPRVGEGMSAGQPPLDSPEIRRLTPVLGPGYTYGSVTDKISAIVLTRPTSLGWFVGFAIAFSLMGLMTVAIAWLVIKGTGIWGINIPIGWGFAIVNFVWLIGIGHAGTLISAILFLLNQKWRTSINRFAEAMTLFAVACAGIFPLIHTGRPWMAFYMFPYPSTMGIWPQFRSPIIWDVFAVSTYGTVSLMFWFVGLLPDLATLRDRSVQKPMKIIYGMLAMGWRGSARHWHRYQSAYLLLAGLATPLVLSVHSVISFDFSFAMVLTIAIPLRKAYALEDFITMRHLDNMAKVMLATGLIVAYGYFFEFFFSLYSGNKFDVFLVQQRLHGPYAPFYFALILCNILTPQLLWFYKMRHNVVILFIMSIVVNIGMWLERFVIVVISLTRDFVPSAWGRYSPTFWDWATFIGTIGMFVTLIFLFVRVLPAISIAEMRELVAETSEEEK